MTDKYKEQILALLSHDGGLATGTVANNCSQLFGNKRMNSAFFRGILLELQREGKVKPMDDQKPVCWVLAGEPT